jgi:hypothetical protein
MGFHSVDDFKKIISIYLKFFYQGIQMRQVHNFPTYFPEIYFNIIFPSTSMSPEWALPFRFSDQIFMHF